MKMWGLFAGLLGLPVLFVVKHFSDAGRGRAAAVSFGVILLSIRVFWRLRRQPWFWATILLIATLHVLLVVSVSWSSTSIPAPALAPMGIVDFILIWYLITFVEKLMKSGNETHPAKS